MKRENIEVSSSKKADLTQNSEGIYSNPVKAGFREAVSNSITAVLKAIEEGHIDEEEGVIDIEYDKKNNYIIISDNGIGMTEHTVNNVLSKLSESNTRGSSQMTGKFGIGFFSIFNIVGRDGIVQLYTKSRREDFSGEYLCQRDAFYKKDNVINLPNVKKGYGTTLRFDIPSSFEHEGNIKSWIEELCEFSRVPVLFRIINEKGEERFNEEYCNKTLKNYHEPKKSISIEEEDFEASVTYKYNGKKKFLILDHPTEEEIDGNIIKNRKSKTTEGFIRLKNERRKVIEGDNEGKYVVDNIEYNSRENPEENDNIIKESEVSDSDIVTPEPVGTRDKVSEEKYEFREYVAERLREKLNQDKMPKDGDSVTVEDVIDFYLDKSDESFYRFIGRANFKRTVIGCLSDYVSAKSDEIREIEESNIEDKTDSKSIDDKIDEITPDSYEVIGDSILEVIYLSQNTDKEIYFGKTINEKKKVFAELVNDCYIVQVDTDYYDLLENYGCKKIKSVKPDADKLDNPEKFKNSIKSQETINIHGESAPRDPTSVKKVELSEHISNRALTDYVFLVDRKLSQNYSKANRDRKIISIEEDDIIKDVIDENSNAFLYENYKYSVTLYDFKGEEVDIEEVEDKELLIKNKGSIPDYLVENEEKALKKYLDNKSFDRVLFADRSDISILKKFDDSVANSINISKINISDVVTSFYSKNKEIEEWAENKVKVISRFGNLDGKQVEFVKELIKKKNRKS